MYHPSDNKQIAKNTLFLYLRMLFVLGITLFTSRIILQVLGVEDFGIYNIVGGVVVLFTFFNQAMATSTQRYISYELGKKAENLNKIFSICLYVHLWLALIVFVLAESIGLWFLNTQLNFPAGRMGIVNWVYQFSIATCIINIVRVPYNAAIIAHEKMSFYAYLGICEAILKLGIVYLLSIFQVDKLGMYALLMFLISVIVTLLFYAFCKRNLSHLHLCKVSDKASYRDIVSFSGWAMFGSLANVCLQQGINIIINIFYGVVLNAAVGIANQVNSNIAQFVSGFQQALNPQLVKSQAGGDRVRQFELIQKSAKFSYLILLVVAFPILINLEYILSLWLGHYPNHTAQICKLIIIGALIECFSGPLWVTIFATGKIKAYQITISAILLLNLPLCYIGGLYEMTPETMFAIRNGIYVCAFITRLWFLQRMISLDICSFVRRVMLPSLAVTALLVVPIVIVTRLISPAQDFIQLVGQTFVVLIYEMVIILFVGLERAERNHVFRLIRNRFIPFRI